jgi:hypothetical protein
MSALSRLSGLKRKSGSRSCFSVCQIPEGANGVKLGRGNRKDHKRSADEKRWGMGRADLETRILRLRKQGMGIVKVGRLFGLSLVFLKQPWPSWAEL